MGIIIERKSRMNNRAAVLTISDKGSRGERTDTSGPAVGRMLVEYGWEIIYTCIIPDEMDRIKEALIRCADEMQAALIITTGGTGFSPRDITPEATLAVIEREARGIPEAMRAESMRLTPKGCLSRSVAGIRGRSLIINLPGSEKAARENLAAVIEPVRHGIEMLYSEGSADCGAPVADRKADWSASEKDVRQTAVIRAVCVSEKKGERKRPVKCIELVEDWGIQGDAHAGNWHRQVSILGAESVAKLQESMNEILLPGDFAENILAEGVCFYELPVGTKLQIGTAVCEVTQIGKECHQDCEIRKKTGDCVMPREGIFVRVNQSGKAKAGDRIIVL